MMGAERLGVDLVLTGGRVLTMDARDSEAEAVAVSGERIVAVGVRRDIEALIGPATRVIDLQGRVVLPGLVDVHAHLANGAGKSTAAVECRDFYVDVPDIPSLLERLRRRAAELPPGQWVVGRGSPMQEYRLAERRLPTKAELDAAVPNHPCYISFGAHYIVANSLALREKGIDRHTPDPQGGTIVRDPVTGEPTGFLRERAQYLVRPRQAGVSPEQLAEGVRFELEQAAARGVTCLHDIPVSKEELLAYQLLERSDRLPIRVQLLIRVIESCFKKESLLDLGLVQGFGSDMLRIGGVKMSIDGGITGRNSAFREPLEGGGDNPRLIRITQDELDETVRQYHELGMRCCIHAIGDLAMDMALEAYEKALAARPRVNHRHRVEHLGNWMITSERLERMQRLQILPIPNPPLIHFLGDQMREILGPRRMERAFPYRTLWEAGFPLSFGSDAPNYWPVDVLRDLGTTVARKTPSGEVIEPDERLTVRQALRAQTANAAYVGFVEDRLGTIEPGKLADLTVLGDDPFDFPPQRFRELPVDVTIVGGRVVYQRG